MDSSLLGGDSVATTAVDPRPFCWECALFLSEDSSIRVNSYQGQKAELSLTIIKLTHIFRSTEVGNMNYGTVEDYLVIKVQKKL